MPGIRSKGCGGSARKEQPAGDRALWNTPPLLTIMSLLFLSSKPSKRCPKFPRCVRSRDLNCSFSAQPIFHLPPGPGANGKDQALPNKFWK